MKRRRPDGVKTPRPLTASQQLAISLEAQGALAARNHELTTLLHQERQRVDQLREELMQRPPPSDLLEERARADRAERRLARLIKRQRGRRR